MPAKPSWLLHIPEIVSELSGLDTPVVDRAVCERLFHVGRRQANHLMRGFGGYLSGNTVLLDRADLISTLEQLANTPEVAHEHTRKRRLADALDELNHRQRARRIRLPVSHAAVRDARVHKLPVGVALTSGLLTVHFDSTEDLFARLYELGQIATRDFEGLREIAETRPASPRTEGI